MAFYNNVIAGAAGAGSGGDAGFKIERSLRFNSGDSAYLNRTPSSAGNRQTWTWAGWVKRTKFGTEGGIFSTYAGSHPSTTLFWETEALKFQEYTSSYQFRLGTTAVYRDPSSWYHIVLAYDSTESTASDRAKLWVNGIPQTLSGTTVPSNHQTDWNSATQHDIGRHAAYLDGYLADVYFIDGQALAATDFGELDDNNVWQPKAFAGTYGTNGFHLDFSDNSSVAALGYDAAGSNHWTVNNIGVIDSDGTIYAEFDGSTSQYLRNNSGNVLPGSNGAFTIECHFYPHTTNVVGLFDGGTGSTNIIRNYGNNTIGKQGGGSVNFAGDYTQNAWNHIAVVYTGLSSTDTMTVYVNGVSSGSSQNLNGFSPGSTFDIGVINDGGDGKFDGYIRNFRITHSAVYTSDFTAPSHTDNLTALTDTKLLVITTPDLGLTGAGPGTTETTSNNGSVSSVTLAAASQNDSFIDSPTNYEASSGNNGGNYCIFNALDKASSVTLSNGNLDFIASTSGHGTRGTIGVSSGKWYWEVRVTTANNGQVGIAKSTASLTSQIGSDADGYSFHVGNGNKQNNGSYVSYGTGCVAGDIVGVALDLDSATTTLTFYKNGTSLGTAYSGISGTFFPAVTRTSGDSVEYAANFGQRPFTYTPPTGYVSLCTTNLADPTIADGSTVMDVAIWTGDGTSRNITIDGGFSPDLVWVKNRSSNLGRPLLYDAIRGAGQNKALVSDGNDAEGSVGDDSSSGYVASFLTDGFRVNSQRNTNIASDAYVAWCWDAGDSNTTISAGSLNSSVYDQSRTWSGGTTSGSLFSGAWSQVFNNVETNTYSDGNSVYVYQNTATLNFATALPSGVIQIWGRVGSSGSSGDKVTFSDGTNTYTTGDLSNQTAEWIDVNNGSSLSGITSVTVHSGSSSAAGMVLGAIRIGGKKLVDSSVSVANVPSIASTCRTNQSAGFSIISYQGNGGNNQTVGHNLNAKPSFYLIKNRSSAVRWTTYHIGVGPDANVFLNETGGVQGNTGVNGTSGPDSSVFYLKTNYGEYNTNGDNYIAYCFAPVEGYSAFGTYTGNGLNDGPFVYTGFRPRFILAKITSGNTDDWILYDTERSSFNAADAELYPNNSVAEVSGSRPVDILSNGFKIRNNSNKWNGASSYEYIFAAFAEHPFKTTRAR